MRLRAMIAQEEGTAALERLVASATSELLIAFTDAHPDTPLVESRLRERGLQTWADLIAWIARKDVSVRITYGEPDPLMSPEAHRRAWMQASGFANVVSRDAQILCAPHGQRAGTLWRTAMPARVARAMRLLKSEDPARLTPVQRDLIVNGPAMRPAQVHQSFAIADGKTAMLGTFVLRTDTAGQPAPSETRLVLTDDSDFAAALRNHFAETWNAALEVGAESLASRATQFDTRVKPQPRKDLRVLRSFANPVGGASRLLPDPHVSDLETALPAAFSAARRYVFVETTTLRHPALVEALADASVLAPDLQVILVLPETPPAEMEERDWDGTQARGLLSRTLDRLSRGFGDRLALVSPKEARLSGSVVIVDDSFVALGPFGLSPRSTQFDTGVAAAMQDIDKAEALMGQIGQRWTGVQDYEALRLASTWTQAATESSDRSALTTYPRAKGLAASSALWRLPETFF